MRSTSCVLGLALLVIAPAVTAAPSDWHRHEVERYGADIAYPASIFILNTAERPGMDNFATADDTAKFVIGSWQNDGEQTPANFRQSLLDREGMYEDVTYGPSGRDWFVLSGYRGDEVYYEKVMFSCRRNMISVFAISYPIDQRDFYEPIVERMENSFRPAKREASGNRCR